MLPATKQRYGHTKPSHTNGTWKIVCAPICSDYEVCSELIMRTGWGAATTCSRFCFSPPCCILPCHYHTCAAAGVFIGQCAGQQGIELWDQVEQAEQHHHQHHGIRLKSLRAQQAAPHSGAPNYSSFTCTGVSHTCLLLLP